MQTRPEHREDDYVEALAMAEVSGLLALDPTNERPLADFLHKLLMLVEIQKQKLVEMEKRPRN